MEILKTRRDIARDENRIPKGVTMFLPGLEFKAYAFAIAGEVTSFPYFARSASAPPASAVRVSTDDSVTPIYLWGAAPYLYWYTDAETAETNIDASHMFEGLLHCKSFDLTGIQTRFTQNFSRMFRDTGGQVALDVSGFDMRRARNLEQMFAFCRADTLDLSAWETPRVTNTNRMFFTSHLREINCSGLNMSMVIDAYGMFMADGTIETIDLSNITQPPTTADMGALFANQSALTTIYVTDADFSGHTNSGNMFSGCTSLIGGAGTRYDVAHTDGEYARVDNPPYSPGYFTLKP